MSETFSRVNVTGPSHVHVVSGFEFLLNESLLEKHITKENADPSAIKLILQFLQEAEAFQSNDSQAEEPVERKPSVENKKVKAVRLLALKAAAFLKWDLIVLEKGLPACLLESLITELLRIAIGPEEKYLKRGLVNTDTMPDHAAFAIQLYHRWCLRTIVHNSFPVKPVRTGFVTPGQVENNPIIQAKNEAIISALQENESTSDQVLLHCVQAARDLRVPSIHSFGHYNENTDKAHYDPESGLEVPLEELKCSAAFDLGTFYFYQEKYDQAWEMFILARDLYKKIGSSIFSSIDTKRLKGYLSACSNVRNMQDDSTEMSLMDQVEMSKKKGNFKSMIEVLIADNLCQELRLDYRAALEDELYRRHPRDTTLHFQLQVCNLVRRVMEGRAILTDLSGAIQRSNEHAQFVLRVLKDGMQGASHGQRANVKCLVRHISQCLPQGSHFRDALLHGPMQSYFTEQECSDMTAWDEDDNDGSSSSRMSSFVSCSEYSMKPPSLKGHQLPSTGELERQLLSTYDPTMIQELLNILIRSCGKTPVYIMNLNEKWQLSLELKHCLNGLSQGSDSCCVFILIAKAKHCLQLKIFERARQLLQVAENIVQDTSYTLSKRIRWQLILADIQQYLLNESVTSGMTVQDLAKKAKTCLTALRLDTELQPSGEIVEHCSSFLLNIKDWQYMCNLDNSRNGYIEMSRLMADVCKELPIIKTARKPAKDFWEAVVQIFLLPNQPKRGSAPGGGGSGFNSLQPGILSKDEFLSLMLKLKDPVLLTMLISCLTKLYNILKDDLMTDISSDFASMWPTALNKNTSSLNLSAISDTVAMLLQHAIQTHPSQPSWLKTQADIFLVHSRYAPAMKFYLESGVVATDFFTDPITKTTYDDSVYRKMIKCCSHLQCHTQVAILCQFLDEIDYSTSFKSLQEKDILDGMDIYYRFIWDATILEFLVHMHTRRGEMDKKKAALHALMQLDLNSNNPEDVLLQAISLRKARFLQALCRQYL